KSGVINIIMENDALITDDVVVVGYGSMQKREVTSSITSIKNKDLIPGVASSPLMAMQGKVTGLSVVSTQGTDPNAGVSLQLRGANSVNASAGPLVVVDGVPGGNINSIPREDIVSIDVLKDASAAAIYGTRASGGVILVTTRQAKSGPVQVSYTGEFSTESIRKKADVLSPEEFVENGQGKDLGYKTDWFDLVTQTPFTQRHNISLAGGTDKFNAYTSLNYKNAEGIAIGSERQEIGARFNFNYKTLKDILEFQGNVSYTNVKLKRTSNDIFNQALKVNPTQTAFNDKDLTGYNVWTGGYDLYNPLADIMLREDQGRQRNLQASLTTKVNITKKLSTQLMIATKDNTSNDIYWRSKQHKTSRESGVAGYASQSMSTYNDVTLDWLVNYKNTWNKHNFGVMAGYSFQEFNGSGFNAENQDFPVDGVTWN
ncbi:MAG: TonB-dependent receptor plug domain-containing protein, partial [Rikenellaceae bacterium]